MFLAALVLEVVETAEKQLLKLFSTASKSAQSGKLVVKFVIYVASYI